MKAGGSDLGNDGLLRLWYGCIQCDCRKSNGGGRAATGINIRVCVCVCVCVRVRVCVHTCMYMCAWIYSDVSSHRLFRRNEFRPLRRCMQRYKDLDVEVPTSRRIASANRCFAERARGAGAAAAKSNGPGTPQRAQQALPRAPVRMCARLMSLQWCCAWARSLAFRGRLLEFAYASVCAPRCSTLALEPAR